MSESPKNGNGMWKTIALMLGSALVTLAGSYIANLKGSVSKDELPGLIQQYSPYTADQKDIKSKLDDLKAQAANNATQLQELKVEVAKVANKLGVQKR